MSRCKKRKKHRKKKRRKLLLISVLIGVFSCSLSIYGQEFFYAMKTFLYEDKALEIKVEVEKNDDLDNINLNFYNEGSCDVYLRGFVFVYPKNEESTGTILSNSSVQINYSEDDCWFISEDNYVYYTKPLKVENRTEKPMVESIELNLSDDDIRMLGGNEIEVDIVIEAVQVNNFAYKYEWDMSDTDLEDLFNSSKKEERRVMKLIFN